MKITIQDINTMSIDDLSKLFHEAKVFELKELLAEINDSPNVKISEHKKKNVIELLEYNIKEKSDAQIRKFKKTLSPVLEVYLSDHFPAIESIHDIIGQEHDKETPMSCAILERNLEVIKELVQLEGDLASYAGDELFQAIYDSHDVYVVQTLFQLVRKESHDSFAIKFIINYSNQFPHCFWAYKAAPFTDQNHAGVHALLLEHMEKASVSVNPFEGKGMSRVVSSGAQPLNLNLLREDPRRWAEWQMNIIIRFFEFFISNIKEAHLLNFNENNIGTNAKEFMSTLIELLNDNLRNRDKKTSSKIEAQLVELPFKLITKIYNVSPDALRSEYNQLLAMRFASYSYETNIYYQSYPKTWSTEVGQGHGPEILLNNIDSLPDQDIMELLLEAGAFSEEGLENMVLYCIEKENIDGLKFLMQYHHAFITLILKKCIVKNLEHLTKDAHADFVKACLARSLFALQQIGKLTSEEQGEIENLFEKCLYKQQLYDLKSKVKKLRTLQFGQIEAPKFDFECDIDDSLFGHIHNDYALKGTRHLEGNQANNTLRYLYKFLTASIEGRWKIEGMEGLQLDAYIVDLKKIRDNIFPALQISEKMAELLREKKTYALTSEQDCIEEVSLFTVQKLIQNKGNIVSPGGWLGLNGRPGHAMLYEFKVEGDKWYFIIRNTGAGLQFHQKAELANDERHSSVMIFEMPFGTEHLKEHAESLPGFIRRLIAPNMSPAWGRKCFDENKIYNDILTNAALLGFREIDVSAQSPHWILGQRSGTCAWKVEISYLKTFPYSDSTHYENLRFEIKRFSLVDYVESNTAKQRLAEPVVQHQLAFALQNSARMINKQGHQSKISQLRQAGFFNKIKEMTLRLGAQYPLETDGLCFDLPQYRQSHIPVVPTKALASLMPPVMIRDDIKPEATYTMDFVSEKPNAACPPITKLPSFNAEDPVKCFLELLEICRKNHSNSYYMSVINQIDAFYVSISNPNSVFNTLSQKDLKIILQCLANVNAIYASACSNQDLKPFADNLVMLYRGKMLAARIVELYCSNQNVKRCILAILCGIGDMESIVESPYFITCNPVKNAKMRENYLYFRKMHEALKNEEPMYASYVHALINESKSVLQALVTILNADLEFQNYLTTRGCQLMADVEKATYYYLKNRNTLKSNPAFQAMDATIEVRLCLEQISTELDHFQEGKIDVLRFPHTAESIAAEYPRKEVYESYFINQKYTGEFECYVSIWLRSIYEGSKQTLPMSSTQPSIDEENISNRLKEKRYLSNIIQTSDKKGVLSENIALKRTLSNIRIHPDTQVVAIVDFMKKEFARLTQKDIQQYVFINLFQFDFIEEQLVFSADLATDLAELILKGFKINIQAKNIKDPAFFFMKIASALRQVLSIQNISYDKTVNEMFDMMDDVVERQLDYRRPLKKDTYMVAQLRRLYGFRLWNLKYDIKHKGFTTEHACKIIEALIFRRNLSDFDKSDPFVESQVQQAMSEYIPLLQALLMNIEAFGNAEDINMIFRKILANAGMQILDIPKNGYWQLNFPTVRYLSEKEQAEKININIISGQVFLNDKRIIPLPPEVTAHPLFARFFNEKLLQAHVSADHKSFSFTIQNEHYRFSLAKEEGILQKHMEIEGVWQWYQYSPKDHPSFPDTFRQFATQTWVSVEPTEHDIQKVVILNPLHSEKVRCYYNTADKIPYRMTPQGRQELINHKSNTFLERYALFTQFEDPAFLEFWTPTSTQIQSGIKLCIGLSRYGIEFEERDTNGQTEIVFLQDERYKLDLHYPYQVISGFNAMFVLCPRTEDVKLEQELAVFEGQDKLSRLALVPIQEFMVVEDKPDNEYYLYHFDTQNAILKRRLLLAHKFTRAEINDPKYVYLSYQEKYATYKLEGKNQLMSESTRDTIYLSYVYLAKRLPLLAFNTLKVLLNEAYVLTAEQLEWLRRMIQELPAAVALDAGELYFQDEAWIAAPEYSAVRLLAALVLANHKLQYPLLPVQDSLKDSLGYHQNNPGLRIANKDIITIMSNKTKEFYGDDNCVIFKKTLKNIYEAYRKTYNNIPKTMRLDVEQEHMILKAFFQKDNLPAVHIQFRKKMLALDRWVDEKSRLNAHKASMRADDWLAYYQRLDVRSKQLEARLNNVHNMTSMHSQVLQENVKITFNPSCFSLLSRSCKAILYGEKCLREARKLNVRDWHLDTSLQDFLCSFFDFYFLAKQEMSYPERQALFARTDHHLNYVARLQHNGGATNNVVIDNLVIVLSYVLRWPEEFSQAIDDKNTAEARHIALNNVILTVQRLEAQGKSLLINITVHHRKLVPGGPLIFRLNAPSSKESVLKIPLNSQLSDGTLPKLDKYYEMLVKEIDLQQKILDAQPIAPLFTKSLAHDGKDGVETKTIHEHLWREFEEDYIAGVHENRKDRAKIIAMHSLYESSGGKIITDLYNDLLTIISNEQSEVKTLEKDILILANLPPDNAGALQRWELNLLGLQTFKLTMPRLLHLFLAQDRDLLKEFLSLNEENTQKLKTNIFHYLIKATYLQHCERIYILTMQCLKPDMTQEEHEAALNDLARCLSMKRSFNPYLQPVLLLFEYLENKMLYPKQCRYIEDLIKKNQAGYISQSIQLIMGDGKSTVIGPVVAVLKADGIHLSIVEVPIELLDINLADFNQTTQTLLDKSGHKFLFDDTVNCTVNYLKNLLDRLRTIIRRRDYLMTNKESLQSFELKYLKLLRFGNIKDFVVCQKLKYFDEIVNLFRDANLLIDEADSALDGKKQLIHTVGKGEMVPQHEIEGALDLFEFLEEVPINDILGIKDPITMQDIVLEDYLPSLQQWPLVLLRLSQSLITHTNSPLYKIMASLQPEINQHEKEELRIYIFGKAKSIPSFIYKFTEKQRDVIALYKEELSNVLAPCLEKLMDENIGLSRDDKKKGFEREIAIPYIGNNVPNEPSRFGHYVETINHTIKIQRFLKSLSPAVVKSFFKKFLEQAEAALGPGGNLKIHAKILQEFYELTNCNLEEIDLDNELQFMSLYQFIKDKAKVKRYCLCHHILNYVEKNARTARSDAQNHASQCRSIQGMTGTNWNYRCHPIAMKANQAASLGTDGQTIDHLLMHPMTPVLLPKLGRDAKKIIEYFFTKYSPDIVSKMRAWIDLGACFKSVSERDVANMFSKYFANQGERLGLSHLLYILYVADGSKLHALKICKNPETSTPIWLKRTDEKFIKLKLGCGPDQRFTYYDQVHGRGLNITQAEDACAIVTLGFKTCAYDLYQKSKRMRKLGKSQLSKTQLGKFQCVIFMLPIEVQDSHSDISPVKWEVKMIIKVSLDNQINRLVKDEHFRSGIQRIRNTARNDLLERILKTKDVFFKQKMLIIFDGVFFTNVSKTAFEQFKHITSEEDTDIVLRNTANETRQQWLDMLKAAEIPMDDNALALFNDTLAAIIKFVLPICLPRVRQPVITHSLMETEVSIEREEETEKQQELENELDQHFQSDAVPVNAIRWGYLNWETWALEPYTSHGGVSIHTLESMCRTVHKQRTWEFNPNIMVSENFMNTCETQPNKLDAYKKDNIFIVMIQDDSNHTLKFLLITPEEASFFKQKIKDRDKNSTRHIWIESTHNTLFCGKRAPKLSQHYDAYIEQIALFNGDMDVLHQKLDVNSWLRDPAEHIDNKLIFGETMSHLHKDKANLSLVIKQKSESMSVKAKNSRGDLLSFSSPPYSRWLKSYLSAPILRRVAPRDVFESPIR